MFLLIIIGVIFITGLSIYSILNIRICNKCKTINFIKTDYWHRDWEITTYHEICKCKKCGKILCNRGDTISD